MFSRFAEWMDAQGICSRNIAAQLYCRIFCEWEYMGRAVGISATAGQPSSAIGTLWHFRTREGFVLFLFFACCCFCVMALRAPPLHHC